MNKQELIKTYNLTEEQFYGKIEICGGLYLNGLTSIPEGFNPTVGGGLYLNGLTSIPEGFNPTVGGDLYLSGLTSIPEGFNPTVGGYLDLRGLTSIPEGFNPTVGGSLDLRGLTSIPEGFNPTVGGWLDLSGLECNYTKLNGRPLLWEGGKYISIDGIFGEVIHKRGNVYELKKLNDNNVFYCVSDGNGKYSHGSTLKEAKDDLLYKIGNVDKSEYDGYNLSTSIAFEKAIECYRVITGACSFGTKDFITSNNIENREYTIGEMIKLTEGKYGHQIFKNYFVK